MAAPPLSHNGPVINRALSSPSVRPLPPVPWTGWAGPGSHVPTDFAGIVASNAPFARKFLGDDPVLDQIDRELLRRDPTDGFVHGGWYDQVKDNNDSRYSITNVKELRPGTGAERIKRLISGLLTAEGFNEKHCI